jgi:hypothetical protein
VMGHLKADGIRAQEIWWSCKLLFEELQRHIDPRLPRWPVHTTVPVDHGLPCSLHFKYGHDMSSFVRVMALFSFLKRKER